MASLLVGGLLPLWGDVTTPPRVPEYLTRLPAVSFREEFGNVLDRSADVIGFGVMPGRAFVGGFAKEADFYFTGAARVWRAQGPEDVGFVRRVWKAPAVCALSLAMAGAARADLDVMAVALASFVGFVDRTGARVVTLPKLGTNPDGGGLDYVRDVRPLLDTLLDDRFVVLHRMRAAKAGGRRRKDATTAPVDDPFTDTPDDDGEVYDDG